MSQPTVTHRVEFLRHPDLDRPHLPLWGVRIDGTDLRVLVAEATRALWDRELDEDDDTPQEREEFLLRQHAPLYLDDDAARARAHFLGDAAPQLRHRDSGAQVLLGCPCGIDACWPLLATIRASATEVVWSGFHQPHRPEWGELPLGPYVFPRPAYDETLAVPLALAEDPLAPMLGER
ncbi:hypothetical protein GTY65_37515 [Streptomyces sp. SID8379]|uniref:hypothetical protein n=1 Tax=unclassified Streptomyces TaxID=2593676 RepID=UPI000363053E|nr:MULTISPECIES: hypothetical protein [unclassified Streptomyces]MYW69720.1 hypothetical protein [Streptomyces sp. SID8379]